MNIFLLLCLLGLGIAIFTKQKSGQQALREELELVQEELARLLRELRNLQAGGRAQAREPGQKPVAVPQAEAAPLAAFRQSRGPVEAPAAPAAKAEPTSSPQPATAMTAAAPDIAEAPFSREWADEAILVSSARPADTPDPSCEATEEPLLPNLADPAWDQAEPTQAPAPNPAFQAETKASDTPPSPFLSALSELWSWLRLNPLLFGGLSVFLIGVAFALGYLVTHSYISPAMRLLAIGAGGAAMQALGWRLRGRNRLFGLSLIGGGGAALYFTLFAAYRLGILPPLTALLFMVVLVLESCGLALLTDAQLLAVVATAGAISAPLLIDTGSESFVALFGYYALLSAGAAALAAFRRWDLPVLFACAAVYGIGGFWGAQAYRPELLITAECFLVLFFAIFTAAHLLLAAHADEGDAAGAGNPGLARRFVHASLLCGVPLLSFTYHYWLVQDSGYAAALGALALAAVDLALFRALRERQGTAMQLTRDALLVMGLAFLVLAAPLALNAAWTTCTWALQGLAFLWLGLRQDRPFLRGLGYAMQVLAAGALAVDWPDAAAASRRACEGTLALSACGLLFFCHLGRSSLRAWEEKLIALQECWALGFWLLAGADLLRFWWPGSEISQGYVNALLAFIAASCLIWVQIGFRLNWRILASTAAALPLVWLGTQIRHIPALLTMPALPLFPRLPQVPLAWADGGLFALPLAWAVFALSFGRSVWPEAPEKRSTFLIFALLSALGLVLLSLQNCLGRVYAPPLGAALLTALLWLLHRPAPCPACIPDWGIQPERFRSWAGGLLACCLAAWFVFLCGRFDRLSWPYIPLLYPLDLAQLLCIAGLYLWQRQEAALPESLRGLARPLFGLAAFALVNVVAARCVSAVTGCIYSPAPLLRSPALLTTLSLLWGGIALALMVLASHLYKNRRLWFAGLTLLALTLIKLVFLDMADQETLHRSFSFLAVGLLMLVMGYFCPLPPRHEDGEEG